MYGPAKVEERITAISKATGWEPQYHSIDDVDHFKKHMESLRVLDNKGRYYYKREAEGKAAFTFEETEWIRNEYNLCACDFRYWLTRYSFIKDSENNIRRFELRASQEMLVDLWAEREEQQLGIEQIVLKARQQGVSTVVELGIIHRVNFGRGVNAAVASSSEDQAERMAGMMEVAYNEMPYWMQAPPTNLRAGSLMAFGGNSTRLSIYTGRAVNGIARGDTPTVIHLSEVADFPRAKELIENSLFKAVHPSPRVFMVLESTGNGNIGWWPDTWYYSKENFYSGGSRLQPVFFPWFIAGDLFPTKTWLREHPVPHDWSPIAITERIMDKCAAYVHSTPLMRRLLGDSWQLPRHQAWFWELNYLEHAAKKNAKGWLQEMACDDFEALQPKKELVFDLETNEERFQKAVEPTLWGITGEQIMEKNHPREEDIDYESERFRVSYQGTVQTIQGRESRELTWEFIPLKRPENLLARDFSPDAKLLVFHWPEPGYDYTVGVDTGSGVGLDNSVISVNRRSRGGEEPDIQVAEFASNKISSAEMHAYVLAISALYGQEMTTVTEPLVAVEQVRKGLGDVCQVQMKLSGYRRFHRMSRMDGKNPRKAKRESKKEGWYTWDSWSRAFMLDIYKQAVENGWLVLNSPYLLRWEIPAFQIDSTAKGKTRWDHESGKHDDRIFASAIAYIIGNDLISIAQRVKSKFMGAVGELPPISMDFPSPLAVTYSQIAEDFQETLQ